ncbi:radical SAM family heme chaperone HemW [Candidatus Omnitrophota bacterium]
MKTGLYLHIPFCVRKCAYCDFYSIADLTLLDTFVEALCKEIQCARKAHKDFFKVIDTIYFGGGTPSVLGSERIAIIMETIRDNFEVERNSEITIEVNPGTIAERFLNKIKGEGINRLSIGVQSFNEEDLVFLGRGHSQKEAYAAINEAKELFNNYSIDLIHSIPGQSLVGYQESLRKAVQLEIPHVSAYALTIEQNTPLHELCRKGEITCVSEEEGIQFLKSTINMLEKNGYLHYEISNFARSSSLVSRHNAKYWDFSPYLGFGPSAHSFDGNNRWGNVRTIREYFNKISEGVLAIGTEELLSQEQQFIERIMLGLRRIDCGINIDTLRKDFSYQWNATHEKSLDEFMDRGYLEQKGDCVRITQQGSLVYNMIVKELTA